MHDPATILADHVVSLCEKHGIRLYWCSRARWGGAASENVMPRKWIPPIRSIRSYAVAMHEIGHVVGQHQQSRDVIVRERWAWKWTRANALMWNATAERYAKEALDTHTIAWMRQQCAGVLE
jgi:hypothetical protein